MARHSFAQRMMPSHAQASKMVKSEDVVAIHPLHGDDNSQHMLYMLCDGHLGPEAADFVCMHLLGLIAPHVPPADPAAMSPKELLEFSNGIRQAVCSAFVQLEHDWMILHHMAGTTVTLALLTGRLLTVANVGDSSAVLDTGCSLLELTRSHRIQDSPKEHARLKGAGCKLAPLGMHLMGAAAPGEVGVGPVRVWPGGLCVSRSIGDTDAGPEVIPLPHIRQVMVPDQGCRIILASDGLWDVMSLNRAVKLARPKPPTDAARELVRLAAGNLYGVIDDVSVVVVDVLPEGSPPFPSVALRMDPKRQAGSKVSGLLSCFRPEVEEPDSRDVVGTGHLAYFVDVDGLQEFPKLLDILPRSAPKPNGVLPHRTEFTMHGANGGPGPPLLQQSMSAPPLQLPGSCCDGADRNGSTMATSSSTGGGDSGGGRNNRDGRIGTTTSNGGRGGAGGDSGGDRRPTTSSGGRGGGGGCDGGGGRAHPQLRRSAEERMLAGSSSGSGAAAGTGFGAGATAGTGFGAEATSPGNKGCTVGSALVRGSMSGRHAASPWLPTTCEEDEGHAGLGARARDGVQHVLVGR